MQLQLRHAEAVRKTDLAPATQHPQVDCEAGPPGPRLRAGMQIRERLLFVSERRPDLGPGTQRIPRILRNAPDRPRPWMASHRRGLGLRTEALADSSPPVNSFECSRGLRRREPAASECVGFGDDWDVSVAVPGPSDG